MSFAVHPGAHWGKPLCYFSLSCCVLWTRSKHLSTSKASKKATSLLSSLFGWCSGVLKLHRSSLSPDGSTLIRASERRWGYGRDRRPQWNASDLKCFPAGGLICGSGGSLMVQEAGRSHKGCLFCRKWSMKRGVTEITVLFYHQRALEQDTEPPGTDCPGG